MGHAVYYNTEYQSTKYTKHWHTVQISLPPTHPRLYFPIDVLTGTELRQVQTLQMSGDKQYPTTVITAGGGILIF